MSSGGYGGGPPRHDPDRFRKKPTGAAPAPAPSLVRSISLVQDDRWRFLLPAGNGPGVIDLGRTYMEHTGSAPAAASGSKHVEFCLLVGLDDVDAKYQRMKLTCQMDIGPLKGKHTASMKPMLVRAVNLELAKEFQQVNVFRQHAFSKVDNVDFYANWESQANPHSRWTQDAVQYYGVSSQKIDDGFIESLYQVTDRFEGEKIQYLSLYNTSFYKLPIHVQTAQGEIVFTGNIAKDGLWDVEKNAEIASFIMSQKGL